MTITVFDPQSVEVAPIGPMMASKVTNEGLKEFFAAKSKEGSDGNLSSIVIGDSANMGVGVGTWGPGQRTKEPIPVLYDEALFIVEGSFELGSNGQTYRAKQGECVHIAAGSMVNFGSEEGCRLVWVSSPPTWQAFEMAWEGGLLK